jgi:hypothetical protein
MRHTNVRHLLRDFKEEIKNLPVTVTQLGQPIFKIVPMDEVDTPEGFKPKEVTFVPEISEKNLGKCTWKKFVGGAWYDCKNSATIEREGGNVCEEHDGR